MKKLLVILIIICSLILVFVAFPHVEPLFSSLFAPPKYAEEPDFFSSLIWVSSQKEIERAASKCKVDISLWELPDMSHEATVPRYKIHNFSIAGVEFTSGWISSDGSLLKPALWGASTSSYPTLESLAEPFDSIYKELVDRLGVPFYRNDSDDGEKSAMWDFQEVSVSLSAYNLSEESRLLLRYIALDNSHPSGDLPPYPTPRPAH